MTTTIIALALALATDPTSSPTRFDVADAEVETGDASSHLVTYDAEGNVSASLVIWVEPTGRLHFDADFADGLYLSAVIEGEAVEIESQDPAEVAARVAVIDDYLATEQPQAGWFTCAAKTAATAYSCATINPVLCISGTIVAACDCLPLILGEGECW